MKKLLLYLSVLVLAVMSLASIVKGHSPTAGGSKPITIVYLAPTTENNLLHLSLQAHFDLPDFLISAINTGIDLTFIADIEIVQQRKLLPDKDILDLEWHKKLHFYALTRHYVVEDLTFNKQANFNSLRCALVLLGRYNKVPITDKPLSASSAATHARVRVKLSRADLPLPLRLKSYIIYPRPLSSDWHQWSL